MSTAHRAPQLPLTGGPLASPNPTRAPVLSSPAERATYTDTWAVPRAPVHVPSLWPAPGDQAQRRAATSPPARSDQNSETPAPAEPARRPCPRLLQCLRLAWQLGASCV
jgi:hypothetical protein